MFVLSSGAVENIMVVILDFDETLYKKNSFPGWIRYCLRRSLREYRVSLFITILFYVFMRKVMSVYDHVFFKKKINQILYPDSWAVDFCRTLVSDYDAVVVNEVKKLKSSCVIISTAAPACYADHIIVGDLFVVGQIVSSGPCDGGFSDNCGIEKKRRTLNCLRDLGRGEEELVLFTDHMSDAPLGQISKHVFLCNPRNEDLLHYSSQGIGFSVLRSK